LNQYCQLPGAESSMGATQNCAYQSLKTVHICMFTARVKEHLELHKHSLTDEKFDRLC